MSPPEWLEQDSDYHIETGSDDHYKKLGEVLQADHNPVVGVSWNNTQSYVQWLSEKTGRAFRLPTEAEWEYAVRAGGNAAYLWGNNQANCSGTGCGDSYEYTAPVASFSANAYGLYDMHGNVWEWVGEMRRSNYANPLSIVKLATLGTLRGGSWNSIPLLLRSANRITSGISSRNYNFGFRIAIDLER